MAWNRLTHYSSVIFICAPWNPKAFRFLPAVLLNPLQPGVAYPCDRTFRFSDFSTWKATPGWNGFSSTTNKQPCCMLILKWIVSIGRNYSFFFLVLFQLEFGDHVDHFIFFLVFFQLEFGDYVDHFKLLEDVMQKIYPNYNMIDDPSLKRWDFSSCRFAHVNSKW